MITAIKTTPPIVTPQIRPTKNTNDYSNQDSLVCFAGLICGVTVGGVVLIAVIISIFCWSYLWCYSGWCGLD
jgi:hypothetical protein